MIKKNILLVGCGKIGFRHIELLVDEKTIGKIYIYDKSKLNSKLLLNKLNNNKKIFVLKNLNQKLESIFLSIIATHSYRRLVLIDKIIKSYKPEIILAEKIIETKIDLINLYQKKFLKKKIYVNCSNRMRSIFLKIIKKYKKKKIKVNVSGGNWNLLSNSIHFIDLVSFMTDENVFKMMINQNSYLISSKHKNFNELIGEITIKFDKGSILILKSNKNKSDRIIEVVDNKNNKIIANLDKNKIVYPNIKNYIKKQHQSLLTNIFYKKLINKKKIDLPEFKKNIKDTFFLIKELKKNKLFKYKKNIMIT